MPQRSFFLLLGAIALGLGAVMVMRFYVNEVPAPVGAAAPQTVMVVVSDKVIAGGSKVDPGTLKLVAWPAGSVPPGSFHEVAALLPPRVVLVDIAPGEPLLASKLAGSGRPATMSYRIPRDKRAATIKVTDVLGVGGFVFPGDHVDLFVTRLPDGQVRPSTDLLAQGIKVIAVNQDDDLNKNKVEVVQSVTIEVSPLQAQKLALAQVVGTISLTLRNPDAGPEAPLRTVQVGDLHDGATIPPTHPRIVRHVTRGSPPAPTRIEIVRGLDRTPYDVAQAN